MFTQLVMLSTVILLLLVGGKIFRQSQKTKYFYGKLLSLGLFFVVLGIFIYSVRDILTQFGMYQWELVVGKSGIFFHVLGGVLILRFLTQAFTPGRFRQIFFIICILYIVVVLISLIVSPLVSERKQAPFEPFSYEMIRYAPAGMSAYVIVFIFVIGPLLLISIVLYNTIKVKEKTLKTKALLYGTSFLFLFIPSIVCLFVSPVYARWGYLIGAILLYKAFQIKE